MEFVGTLEHSLSNLVNLLQLILEAIAVLMVAIGLVRTGQLMIKLKRHHRRLAAGGSINLSFVRIRCQFGMWLALALEFQLGSDVLATTVTPSFEELGKLATIAVIRTFLNYFLNQELESETQYQEQTGRELQNHLAEPET